MTGGRLGLGHSYRPLFRIEALHTASVASRPTGIIPLVRVAASQNLAPVLMMKMWNHHHLLQFIC